MKAAFTAILRGSFRSRKEEKTNTGHDRNESDIKPSRLADHETSADNAETLKGPDGPKDDQNDCCDE